MRHILPITLLIVAMCAPAAFGAGRWNLPSTTLQYVGYGFGPGYHAPYYLGPAWKGKAASPGVRRLSSPPPPMPPGMGMSILGACPECVPNVHGPTMIAPQAVPQLVPEYSPSHDRSMPGR